MGCTCQGTQSIQGSSNNVNRAVLTEILERVGRDQNQLISILQAIQEKIGYLPEDMMLALAEETGIKAAKIYGVATFYTQFRLKPVGRYLIMLCQGTACHVNGAGMIETTLKEHLHIGEGETTPDGLFTLNNVACLGCCSLAPVMMINGETYAKLTPDLAISVIEKLRSQGVTEVSE